MIDLSPLVLEGHRDQDTGESVLTFTDPESNDLILRFRYTPEPPEARLTELTVTLTWQDNRLGTRFIVQVFDKPH
jgi:hypothetical protein